jgi:hypothetical protein
LNFGALALKSSWEADWLYINQIMRDYSETDWIYKGASDFQYLKYHIVEAKDNEVILAIAFYKSYVR